VRKLFYLFAVYPSLFFFCFPDGFSFWGLRLLVEKGQNNLAFVITLQLADAAGCVDLLVKAQRAPEAALFART
jgi:hypothetical protein